MAEKSIRKTTTGKGANYRKTKSGAGMTAKGVIKGLKKASKLHAKQAKTLKGVIRGTRANTK